jgi:hypothetical protein
MHDRRRRHVVFLGQRPPTRPGTRGGEPAVELMLPWVTTPFR